MAQKSVLITGCSERGIGDALAQEFHSRGLKVFATARNPDKMRHLDETSIVRLKLDVTSRQSVEDAVDEITKITGGKLDLLILNAGMHYFMPFADHDVDIARQMFETNVLSIYTVTQPLLPLLIKAQGTIAMIGSINAAINPPYQTSYNASKTAVQSMTDTMRVELAPLGVKVVNVVTGGVETHLHESKVNLPKGSYYEAAREDIETKKMMRSGWRQEPAEYAKRVASDLLKPNPAPWIWRGGMATVIWVVSCVMRKGWMDGSFIKQSGLFKVKPELL